VLAAKLLRKLGALDLAMLASDRAATSAMHSSTEADRALTAYQVVAGLLRSDQVDDAETLAVNTATSLGTKVRQDEPELLSAVGAMWLLAAVIAARRTDKYEALRRLDRAGELAKLLGRDANYGWTAFGPTMSPFIESRWQPSWASREKRCEQPKMCAHRNCRRAS